MQLNYELYVECIWSCVVSFQLSIHIGSSRVRSARVLNVRR